MEGPDTEDYIHALKEWRGSMDAAIRKENGWLALAGLYWLHVGENTFGSAGTNDFVLPAPSPARAGAFLLENDHVRLKVSTPDSLQLNGMPATDGELEPDTSGEPTVVGCGQLTMIVVQRGERLGVRLWDNSRPARETYPGRAWFQADVSWRIEATYRSHDPPLSLMIPNVLGDLTEEAGVGRVEFERDGRVHRLEALRTESGGVWLIFGDRTNGRETYPSGRFLVCQAAEPDRITVDFNRAYNPPCAFTEFATCPLPPRVNFLELRVEAGERYRPLDNPPD